MQLRLCFATALVAGALAFSGCGSSKTAVPTAGTDSANTQAAAQPAPFNGDKSGAVKPASLVPTSIIVPLGTPVTVRLQQAVSSASAQSGQEFDAVLDQPLVVNGQTVAESGAAVRGRVISAKQSGRLSDPGYLRLGLAAITVNGKSMPLSSSSVVFSGASHKKRDLGWIGGGAAGGALIGGLMGGGKGALIGSAVGAGAGTTTAYATGKKDVGIGAERRLTFKLTQPLKIG